MTAVALVTLAVVVTAGAWRASARRRRDPLEALGPLPADWHPVARTIVRTRHLAPWLSPRGGA